MFVCGSVVHENLFDILCWVGHASAKLAMHNLLSTRGSSVVNKLIQISVHVRIVCNFVVLICVDMSLNIY